MNSSDLGRHYLNEGVIEVKQIGNYIKLANELKSNFSFVRYVLHDYRYERMQPKIIPESIWKKARQMLDKNRKNRTT